MRGALGLSRRKVVTHETVVAQNEVLLGAALIGGAAAFAAGAVARLQASLAERRSFRLACHVAGEQRKPAAAALPVADEEAAGAGATGGGSLAALSAASASSVAASAALASAVAASTGAAVRVVVLRRRDVARGGLAALRAQVGGGDGDLLVWCAGRKVWEPLLDVDTLPRCASLRLGGAHA